MASVYSSSLSLSSPSPRHHTSNSYFGHKQVTTYGQVFGLPVVVTVSRKGCTYRALYDTIMSQITRFVIKPEKEKKGEEEERMAEEESETVDGEMKETEEGTICDGAFVWSLISFLMCNV